MMLFGNVNRVLEECCATSDAILVDVREADEFASGHIPGAVNEPLSTISNTVLPKNAPLFLYCLRGTRSKRAAGSQIHYDAHNLPEENASEMINVIDNGGKAKYGSVKIRRKTCSNN